MPRTLPWLADAKSTKKKPTSSAPAPKRKRTPTSDDDLVDADLNPISPSPPPSRPKRNAFKSPSTSPPPAPPPAEPMLPADDVWMMVEDEFLATAQLYTQHLHHAAYAEAKRAARARGAKTLRGIQRSTDGKAGMSMAMKVQMEKQALAEGRGGEEEESDSDAEAWAVNPQLAGLMSRTEVRNAGREVAGLGKVRSDTRASKGFLRSLEKAKKWSTVGTGKDRQEEIEEDEDEDESDDLDRPVRVKTEPVELSEPSRAQRAPAKASRKILEPHDADSRKVGGTFKLSRKPPGLPNKASTPAIRTESADPQRPRAANKDRSKQHAVPPDPKSNDTTLPMFDDFDIVPEKPTRERPEDFLARRRALKEKREKEKTKSVIKQEFDDVPTFII